MLTRHQLDSFARVAGIQGSALDAPIRGAAAERADGHVHTAKPAGVGAVDVAREAHCHNCGEGTKAVVRWKAGQHVPLCPPCGVAIREAA